MKIFTYGMYVSQSLGKEKMSPSIKLIEESLIRGPLTEVWGKVRENQQG